MFAQKNYKYNFIRFIAAIMVLIAHSFVLSLGTDCEKWVLNYHLDKIGVMYLGRIAVAIFFFGSGFFVSKSCERNENFWVYIYKRAKRIIPMLAIIAFLSIAIVGTIMTKLSLTEYLFNISTWKYMLNSVFVLVHNLPGVFNNNVYGSTVNGSLWTLPVEFICYIFCFLVFKYIFTKNKKIFKFSVILSVCIISVIYILRLRLGIIYDLICPVFCFWEGMIYWCYKDKIRVNKILFLIMCIALGIGIQFDSIVQIGIWIAIPYIIFFLMFYGKQHFEKVEFLGNISYCMYLIGFPIQQTIISLYGGTMNPFLNIVIAIPIDIALSYILYNLIEKRIK